MTLSAAIVLEEAPYTFSDILVTGPAEDRPHIDVPTGASIDNLVPQEWCSPAVGLVRKTYILADNLVVCFAGDSLAALSVLKELKKEIKVRRITLDEFQNILSKIDGLGNRTTNVTASLMEENGPISIAWHSANPERIGTNSWALSGSGMSYFAEFSRIGRRKGPRPSHAFENTRQEATTIAASLIGHEVMHGGNLQYQFGAGFEATYYNENRFKFVKDYALTFWVAQRDAKGIGFRHVPQFLIVSYLEEMHSTRLNGINT